jgi:hypothetical protein
MAEDTSHSLRLVDCSSLQTTIGFPVGHACQRVAAVDILQNCPAVGSVGDDTFNSTPSSRQSHTI